MIAAEARKIYETAVLEEARRNKENWQKLREKIDYRIEEASINRQTSIAVDRRDLIIMNNYGKNALYELQRDGFFIRLYNGMEVVDKPEFADKMVISW